MFIDFDPQAPLAANTNGTLLIANMINNKDSACLTQCASALKGMGDCTNGYFSALVGYSSEEDKKFLHEKERMLELVGLAIAEFVDKKCDATYSRNVKKERTVTVDIPKVRNVGLFKKEKYVDHETKTESYTEKEPFTYNGWIIEKLCKKEDYGQGHGFDVLNMDYCLGRDGKIYLVLTANGDLDPVVFKCICYSPLFLAYTFCNIYIAAIAGVTGVLDAIPIDKDHPLRNTHIVLDDDYYYNFPIQIDDKNSFPYSFLDGAVSRMILLLDERGKQKCVEKYDWMKPIIYPEKSES